KREIHENCRVVDFNLEFFRAHWLFERQCEIEGQDLVSVIEPVIGSRFGQLRFFSVGGGISEVIEFLQRLVIDLGKRRQFPGGGTCPSPCFRALGSRTWRTCHRTTRRGGSR